MDFLVKAVAHFAVIAMKLKSATMLLEYVLKDVIQDTKEWTAKQVNPYHSINMIRFMIILSGIELQKNIIIMSIL